MSSQVSLYYINGSRPDASKQLALRLWHLIRELTPSRPPVVLCIGTDRVTGDSLGPLAGTFLHASGGRLPFPVYGTLEFPVHALNLRQVCRGIKKEHPRSLVLAVDASLGTKHHLGYITLGRGSLQPGAGVQKDLEAVGDLFITGIINTVSSQPQLTLQNTRLAPVTRLACCISQGIIGAFDPALMAAASRETQCKALRSPLSNFP